MNWNSLEISQWLKDGITPLSRSAPVRKFIHGGDTETLEGEPMTFQFYNPSFGETLIWLRNAADASREFFNWCRSLPTKSQHVVYVHNLEFDLVSFLWDVKSKLVSTGTGEFEFELDGFKLSGVYGAPTFVRLTDGVRRVVIVDSFSYYRASLEKAAEVFCPHLPKLKRPEGLGSKRFAKSDLEFCEYAMRDAVVAYHIGMALEGLHDEFDLAQTVSVADMAARIFRRHYLSETMPHPARAITEAALSSYHGGKNNLTVAPGWYTGISSLDISSAYPHAMASFPSFTRADLYKTYRKVSHAKLRNVPELGIYEVSGTLEKCRWPVLFHHDFKPASGRIDGVFVSGFELNEALRMGEFHPTSVAGWYYDGEKDRADPPLRAFCDEFYARKEAEEDQAKRAMYKFILNSVSGKFIQTRKRQMVTYVDGETLEVSSSADLIAGGMFHPFIASLITGHTRARIHRLEHEYEALHTATDGIITRKKNLRLPKSKGLGALVTESQGDILILRNKLYIIYGDGAAGPKQKPSLFEGKHIIKCALHGFAGRANDLERMVITGSRFYSVTKVNRLRTSLQRGLVANNFERHDRFLNVGDLGVY